MGEEQVLDVSKTSLHRKFGATVPSIRHMNLRLGDGRDVARFPTASAVQGATVVPSAKDMYENDPNHSKGGGK